MPTQSSFLKWYTRKHRSQKELYVVEDAEHIDLYDRTDRIPFDKLERFFRENL
ncbi:MAG: hypothetical protein ACLTCQ_02675 [Enterocloster bolteae]